MLMKVTSKDEEIKQNYFLWLCDQVGIRGSRSDPNRIELVWFLHNTIFYGFVPNDDNRAEDGKKLREHYADEKLDEQDCPCLDGQCTVFEMLVSLAIDMDVLLSENSRNNQTEKWFWLMLRNLGLVPLVDDEHNERIKIFKYRQIVDKFLERTYLKNGVGGLFPLRRANEDQRNVEIWYQLQAYLAENYPF